MARQRFIHPEMWDDPVLGRLPEAEMLLYIACFSLADDEGRLLGEVAWLRSHAFAYRSYTDDELRAMRDHIGSVSSSFHVYSVDGIDYISFLNWAKFQTPKYPKPSKLPSPEDALKPRKPSRHGEIEFEGKPGQWVRRGYIRKHVRAAVYERDDHRCQKCGSEGPLAIDHIVAVSKGGSNEPTNLRTLCRSCNSKKGASDERETFLRSSEVDSEELSTGRDVLGRVELGPLSSEPNSGEEASERPSGFTIPKLKGVA